MSILILIAAVSVAYAERSAVAHVVAYIRSESAYDPITIGFVLSAFGWGYVLALPFSGFIIGRLGHRRTLIIVALGWGATAIGFSLSRSAYELAVARFLLGLLEAPLFPLFVSWIAANVPRHAASSRISLVEAASYVGMALSGPLTVWIADQYGWRIAYAGMAPLALVVASLAPHLHEPEQLESNARPPKNRKVPLFHFPSELRVASFIACAFGFLFYNFAKSFSSTWLPAILVQSYNFTSAEAGALTFVQSMLAPIASISIGVLSGVLISRGASTPLARLGPMAVGFGLGSTIALVPFLGSLLEPILVISFVGLISTSALIWSVPADFASQQSNVAFLSGYLNAIANLGTIASPIAIGYLLKLSDGHIYALILLGCASIAAFLSFCIGYLRWRSLQP
jgi:ACS family probable galactarate transporter